MALKSPRDYALRLTRYNEEAVKEKAFIKERKERLVVIEEKSIKLQDLLIRSLEKEKTKTVISGTHQYSTAKTPDAISVPDIGVVPLQFIKVENKLTVDKTLIKKAIKDKDPSIKSAGWFSITSGTIIKHKELETEV